MKQFSNKLNFTTSRTRVCSTQSQVYWNRFNTRAMNSKNFVNNNYCRYQPISETTDSNLTEELAQRPIWGFCRITSRSDWVVPAAIIISLLEKIENLCLVKWGELGFRNSRIKNLNISLKRNLTKSHKSASTPKTNKLYNFILYINVWKTEYLKKHWSARTFLSLASACFSSSS